MVIVMSNEVYSLLDYLPNFGLIGPRMLFKTLWTIFMSYSIIYKEGYRCLRALSWTPHSMNLDRVPNISLVSRLIYVLKCKPHLIIFDNFVLVSWVDTPIIYYIGLFWVPVMNYERFTRLTWFDLG
jgi:hypothetical protein